MTKIIKPAVSGTLESSDIMVTIEPNGEPGLKIKIKSSVDMYYHEAILNTIKNTLEELEVKDANISVVDKGALDCTIRARVITAVRRAQAQDDNAAKGAN